jgi:hypothetical protein
LGTRSTEKVVEKVVVAGRNFVFARLTPAAYQHGLALALPELLWRAYALGLSEINRTGAAEDGTRRRRRALWSTRSAD